MKIPTLKKKGVAKIRYLPPGNEPRRSKIKFLPGNSFNITEKNIPYAFHPFLEKISHFWVQIFLTTC